MREVGRRAFIGLSAAAVAGAFGPRRVEAAATPQVCVFSKHLQFLDYGQLAATCRELQLDGVDLTVRPKGHVLPENVDRDLPRAVETIRKAGLEVPMITTNLNSADDDGARAILSAASQLGISYFRVGNQKYSQHGDPWDEMATFTEELRGLAALADEYDMVAGYHNHSGYLNVGAPMWDLHHMIREINSEHVGSNFDVGHTTVEGAYGDWQITTRLMAPHVKMMAVKDFVWDGDRPKWVPLGDGIVKLVDMLKIMKETGFVGPISMHFEYGTPDDQMIDEIRKTTAVLRQAIADAGYA